MLRKIKLYFRLLSSLKSLYVFIFQRLIIIFNTTLRFNPPYDFERTLAYDSATEITVTKIDQTLKNQLGNKHTNYKAKWESIFQREETGRSVSKAINGIIPIQKEDKFTACVEELNHKGYSQLIEKNLSGNEVGTILDYLEDKKMFPSHVAHRSLKKPSLKEKWIDGINPFGSYDIQTILGSKILTRMVGDEEISRMVGQYFGCVPTLCNINLYWSFVRENTNSAGPQNYHRDVDDHKIVNVFINLTDTAEDDGSYCHIDQTHNIKQISQIFEQEKSASVPDNLNPFDHPLTPEDLFLLPLKGYGFDPLYDHLFEKQVHQVFGPSGTVRCADGYGLHRAIPPISRDRLLFWMTFSLTRASTETSNIPHQKRVAYSKVKQEVTDTDFNRYVLRNILDFRK